MPKKQVIAIDLDDVAADTTEALRNYVNEITGLSLTKEDYSVPATYWGYYETVWSAAGITDMDHIHRFHDRMGENQDNIMPVKNSTAVISKLAQNYHLVAITSRELFMEQETERWVAKNFPEVFQEIVLLGHVKTASQSKGDVCRSLGAKWLLDDNIGHCDSAIDAGLEGILFGDYGWQHELDHQLARCKNWLAVQEYFDGKTAK